MIIRGRTFKITSTCYIDYENGIFANIQTATIKVIFKLDPNDPDADAVLVKTSPSSDIVVQPANNYSSVVITLQPIDTEKFGRNVIYYEVVIKLGDGSLLGNGVDSYEVKGNVLKTIF